MKIAIQNGSYVKRNVVKWMSKKIYPIEIIGIIKEHKRKIIAVSDNQFKSDEIEIDCNVEENKHPEGKLKEVYLNIYERNRKARDECIMYYGATCKVCEFDFEKTYGEIGSGYIQVHHIIPLCEIGEEYKVDSIKDLVPVCPNCHAMLHHNGTSEINISIEELKRLFEENKAN